jgi:hypothetical protein
MWISADVGYGAVGLFGGDVLKLDGLTTNIQISGDWGSVSFGSVILGDGNLYDKYLSHKQRHFMQSLFLGPLYWLFIAIPSITSDSMNDYYGHRNLYTEKWADAWQTKR